MVPNTLSPNISSGTAVMSRFTAAELTALCSTPAGLVALFQLVLAGNVDITTAAVTTPLAAMVTAGAITQARATALATAASVVP